MSRFSYKNYYRRNLPHIQPEGATLFITFRLANSLPKEVIERLRMEKEEAEKKINQLSDKWGQEKQLYLAHRRFFGKWDDALDSLAHGENYLSNPRIADLVAESLLYRDGKIYDLEAFSIMPRQGRSCRAGHRKPSSAARQPIPKSASLVLPQQLSVRSAKSLILRSSWKYERKWRTRQDSNLRPLPSEGSALSS